MTLQYDPYEFADALSRMAIDLASDARGITNIEVSAALVQASQMIEELADTMNHYRMRSRVVVVANGEEIELDDDIIEPLLSEAVRRVITEAVEMYVAASKVVPNLAGN